MLGREVVKAADKQERPPPSNKVFKFNLCPKLHFVQANSVAVFVQHVPCGDVDYLSASSPTVALKGHR